MKSIKIYDEDMKKVRELAKLREQSLIKVFSRAIRNLYQAVIGNRVEKHD